MKKLFTPIPHSRMLFSFLADRKRAAYRIYFFLLVACILVLAGLVAKTGCIHHEDMPWDTNIILSGAYRLHTGQMPHVDYMSPIGLFPTWLVSVGMKIGGANVNAIAYGSALGAVFVALLAWFVSARRLPGFFAFSFSLFVGTLFMACRPLSFGLLTYPFEFSHASYAMCYNRMGWALLSVLAMQSLLSPNLRDGSKIVNDIEAFSAGCLAALLALTKVNYLGAALVISFVWLCVTQPGRRRIFWFVAGIASIPLFLMAFTPFSFQAWAAEFGTLGRLADVHSRTVRMAQLTFGNFSDILFIGAVLLLLKPFCGGVGRLWVICGTCVAIGMVVLNLNMQMHEVPLFAVACAIVLETALRGWKSGAVNEPVSKIFQLWFVVGTCIYLFLLIGTFASDAASIVYTSALKSHMKYLTPDSGIIHSESFGPLLMPPQPGEQVEQERVLQDILARREATPYLIGRVSFTPYQYAHLINDGLALLKPHVTPASGVFCMDLTNPFPLALALPYPKGGALWWDQKTFDQKLFPNAEQVFADVTLVMIPKVGLGHSTGLLQAVYQPYIMEHFSRVSGSALWDLYARKNLALPQAK